MRTQQQSFIEPLINGVPLLASGGKILLVSHLGSCVSSGSSQCVNCDFSEEAIVYLLLANTFQTCQKCDVSDLHTLTYQ